MLSTILGAVGSIFAGGATGLIGVALQRYADYKKQQADLDLQREQHRHDLEMKQADAEIAKQEWAARTQVARVEGDAKVAVAAEEGFAASFKLEPAKYSEGAAYTQGQAWLLVLLDVLRGLVRPGLTVYLCWITTQSYWEAQQLVTKFGAAMTPAQAVDLLQLIVNTILYLTTTCCLWWFGTRNAQQPPKVAPR
jgi:hypothetical protein